MSFEMSCANCEGRLMVETLGIVVACPHCGTHLAIPEEIPGLANPPSHAEEADDEGDAEGSSSNLRSTWFPGIPGEDPPSSIPDFSAPSATAKDAAASESNILISESGIHTGSEVPSAVRVVNPDPSAVMPAIITDATVSEPVSSFPAMMDSKSHPSPAPAAEGLPEVGEKAAPEAAKPDELPEGFPVLDGADSQGEAGSAPNTVTEESPRQSASENRAAPAIVPAAPKSAKPDSRNTPPPPPLKKAERKEPSQQSVYDAVYSSRRGKVIPNPVFQAWLSYTILLTAGLGMAIYYIFTAPTSNLESLPDVKPVEKSGKIVRRLVPEKAAMPPGHTLALNKTQRFGNIEVTPLKVTKGDLTLVGRDYVEDSRKIQREGTVLKLWLKFKNVSQDQTIAPLDNELLFFRDPRPDRKAGALANNFVCAAAEKSEQGNLVLIYDHWFEGDYDLREANIGTELKPGEEVTVYIPTEPEGWNALHGPLLWRVHFRKGYSPNNYGVTTLFEVEFDSDAIQSESASA